MIGGRTAVVAALVGGAISIVLVGWYRAGGREIDGRIAAEVDGVQRDARAREAGLAAALAARLEELRVAESARSYLHYQNLFHDPDGGSEGLSVIPSPLAVGPADPLVATHFQIDERGQVSSPSINDELPEAVQAAAPDRDALASLSAIKGELIAIAARGAVRVAAEPTTVATLTRRDRPRVASSPGTQDPIAQEPAVQTIELPPEAYAQNQMTNAIFSQTRLGGPRVNPEVPVQQAAAPPPPPTAPPAPRRARPRPPPPAPKPPIVITVAPLTWAAMTIDQEPALVALRHVATPDGTRTQGLTVRATALTRWLAERTDAYGATLSTTDGARLGLGDGPWAVRVDASADAAYVRSSAAMLRDDFHMKFVPVAILAVVCGLLVVFVTARGERLVHERARFAAAAAHELRTPLAGIQLYGDMLSDELGDPTKHKDYAHRIAVEAARLGRVVGNVMGVTQLERGSISVRPERAEVVATVRDAIARAEPGLVRAGATVELVAPAEAWALLDRDAVARIVGNLLDNAEKYARGSDDRTITVTVEVQADAVAIAVRDRGPGLPAAMRRGRFRAFRRAADADAPPGLGLGLALSAALAHAMNGSLAPRDVDVGAELVLRVPAAT